MPQPSLPAVASGDQKTRTSYTTPLLLSAEPTLIESTPPPEMPSLADAVAAGVVLCVLVCEASRKRVVPPDPMTMAHIGLRPEAGAKLTVLDAAPSPV